QFVARRDRRRCPIPTGPRTVQRTRSHRPRAASLSQDREDVSQGKFLKAARQVPLPRGGSGTTVSGQTYRMKLVSTRSSIFGIDLIIPISSNRSAASLVKVWNSPAKNFWFAALSCQRKYFAELPNCSPDCFTSEPMIS